VKTIEVHADNYRALARKLTKAKQIYSVKVKSRKPLVYVIEVE